MLFNEALELSTTANREEEDGKGLGGPDKMNPQCFVETVIRNRIGGYGSEFLNFEFLNSIDRAHNIIVK